MMTKDTARMRAQKTQQLTFFTLLIMTSGSFVLAAMCFIHKEKYGPKNVSLEIKEGL